MTSNWFIVGDYIMRVCIFVWEEEGEGGWVSKKDFLSFLLHIALLWCPTDFNLLLSDESHSEYHVAL